MGAALHLDNLLQDEIFLAQSSTAGFVYVTSRHRLKPAPHLQLLSEALSDVAAGREKRLAIFMPPRHAKSTYVSHHFPPWYLGLNPDNRIALASYEARFAASWGRKARDLMREWGPQIFGLDVSKASSSAQEWDLAGYKGGMSTTGVGGPLTGKGIHVLIMDDLIKNAEEARSRLVRDKHYDWYQSTVYTRMEADPEGALILMHTRWNEDDMGGRLVKDMERGGDKWRILSLPAIAEPGVADPLGRQPGEALWPSRFPVERLERIKRVLRSYWFSAMYQQSPLGEEGRTFKPEWLKKGPGLPEYEQIIQSWDTAQKDGMENDYSACVTVGFAQNKAYLLHVWRGHVGTPELLKQINRLASRFIPNVILIEDKASGTGAAQLIKATTQWPIVPVDPGRLDKVARANLVTPSLEAERLEIVAEKGAEWYAEFEDELLQFPKGGNDDMVDAFVYALIRLFVKQRREANTIEQDWQYNLGDDY